MKRSLTVEVAGQKYTFKTDADEAYVESLASFVNDRIEEARRSTRSGTVTGQMLAVLAALNIADDLFQARKRVVGAEEGTEELKRHVRERSQAILTLLSKAEL